MHNLLVRVNGHTNKSAIIHNNKRNKDKNNQEQERQRGDSGGCLAMSSLGI